MRTSCVYTLMSRYLLGYGYGHSSQVMLPGLMSVGVGTGGDTLCPWAAARAGASTTAAMKSNSERSTLRMGMGPVWRESIPLVARDCSTGPERFLHAARA